MHIEFQSFLNEHFYEITFLATFGSIWIPLNPLGSPWIPLDSPGISLEQIPNNEPFVYSF